jgi:hypothetical protein
MKALTMTILLTGMSLVPMAQALADSPCSTQAMAGRWVYASTVSQQVLAPGLPPITFSSIGTINVDRYGTISGKFDFTALDLVFFPDVAYTGSVNVNPDCTGTLYFLTSDGFERTDSIVVVDRNEMLGMSRDPLAVFTYQVRRIKSKKSGKR